MNKAPYISIIIFILFNQILMAQTGILKGTVIDSITNEPIPFGKVLLKQSNNIKESTSTDFDGKFQINSAPTGMYSLFISNIEYFPIIMDSILIEDGITKTITIKMVTRPGEILDEFEILEYIVPIIQKDRTSTGATVTKEEITKMPNRNANTIASTVGGVYSKTGSRGSVRGTRSVQDHSPVIIDAPSGTLTATEINDFSKWELWKNISNNELGRFQKFWKIEPKSRYSIQVLSKESQPVVGGVVFLESADGNVLWKARTDNTGKAELWAGFFENEPLKRNKLVVQYDGESYEYPRAKLIQKGLNMLKIPVECDIPDQIDIAFVVDATGSMDDEIEFLKTDLIDILQHTKETFPEVSVNLGSVFYRCFGNSYVTRKSVLTPDVNQTIDFIKLQDANEGGAEVVEEAFQIAVDELGWSENARAKILFFVLDQQPLSTESVLDKMHLYIKKAAEKGIRVVPIIASAESIFNAQSMEFLMRSIALATNGTTVNLTDHSGVGNDHATPTTDEYDVVLLNSLLKKIIYQYSYVPSCNEQFSEESISDSTFVSNIKIIAHEVVDSTLIVETKPTKVYEIDYTDDDTIEEITTNTDSIKIAPASILFYPNPSSGMVSVEIEGEINELFLFDISGKLLAKFNSHKESKMKLDLREYCNGIYFVKFQDQKRWFSGKLIISR